MIDFFCEDVPFPSINTEKVSVWIEKCIGDHHFIPGNISIIFCSDEYLYEMNNKYLSHNYYTDIITFNYNESNIISGDLFISIDRVKDNAIKLKILFEQELHRVVIHGILHLVGWNDKTDDEERNMRLKENFYLNLF